MAFTNLIFSVGGTLTAANMSSVNSNFMALAHGESGAPKIQCSSAWNISISSQSSWAIAPASTFTVPAGMYNMLTYYVTKVGSAPKMEYNYGGTWLGVKQIGGLLVSDGTNARIVAQHSSGSMWIYYQRF